MAITPVDRLRRMVGDRIPPGKTDKDTFFTDEELQDMLDMNNDDINAAAAEGWLSKAAEFAKLIDQSRAGNTHKLSQMFKNAEAMAEHYAHFVKGDVDAIVGRVVGRAINLREGPTVERVQVGSATMRLELFNTEARALMHADNPELVEADPSYPQPGQVPT